MSTPRNTIKVGTYEEVEPGVYKLHRAPPVDQEFSDRVDERMREKTKGLDRRSISAPDPRIDDVLASCMYALQFGCPDKGALISRIDELRADL